MTRDSSRSLPGGPRTTRRDLLAGATAVAAVGLGGCLAAAGEFSAPSIGSDRIDDYRQLEESVGVIFSESVGPITVEAHEHTLVYERADLATALSDAFDAELSAVLFFASRIDLRPGVDRLPLGAGRERIVTQAAEAADEAFRRQLRESGLENVRHEETRTMPVAGGHEATELRYSASVDFDGSVDTPGGSSEPIAGSIVLEGRLAVWHDGSNVLLAGGAYPTERITDVVDDSLPDGSLSVDDVLDVEVLAEDPAAFAEDTEALMTSVT